MERVEVGADDGGGALFVFADDHHLLDVFRAAQHILDELRGDVFASRELEDVFLAVGDFEVLATDKGADVSRVEPSVGVNDLGGVLGVFVVAKHDMRATGEDFAVVGEFHFHAGEDGSHGADLDLLVGGVVDGDDGAGLREAVALVDVDAGGGEDAYHVGLDGAAAGDDGQAVASELLAPLAVDQTVQDLLVELVHGRELAQARVVIAPAVAEGPVVDGFLQSREVFAGGVEFVVDHLQHPRHGTEAVGFDFHHVLLDGAQAFGVVDADAEILEVVVHRSLVDVVERQEGEDAAARVHRLHLGVGQEVGA